MATCDQTDTLRDVITRVIQGGRERRILVHTAACFQLAVGMTKEIATELGGNSRHASIYLARTSEDRQQPVGTILD